MSLFSVAIKKLGALLRKEAPLVTMLETKVQDQWPCLAAGGGLAAYNWAEREQGWL